MKIPAIAFKAKNKDRYLCDGPDCGVWSDEYLDTQEFTDALFVIKNDLKKPTEEDLQNFYKFMASLPFNNDVEFIKRNYDPVHVELTKEQLEIVQERNEW
ncbi:hypothetical protein [Bacillus pseudomycoides]|uniref:Uncharacterized protein n=1 Tax=Bacillus pseudomycoides TaxID=64104 RepID=A0AAJ2DLI1_9BACI|nr:hypothetical protein [Bacillus pseudomycoides]MDR4328314.1 hypothetical protein [Bacillus pseudomycoides]PEK68666.1 hypothetical protein CN593_11130 [Bacillus pseudomycoides]PFY52316.1 hypothetical protein COL49_29655 [Bacillus pseudomycoides]PGE25305.1 hypothetical protein COM57_21550 [Bacillus pseudomycoides]